MVSRGAQEPLGIRNNNPGNIRVSNTKWLGKIPSDNQFEKFSKPVFGIRAIMMIIKTYRKKYGDNTIAEIINRWAPNHENPTDNYVNFVSKKVELPPNVTFQLHPDVLVKIARAIVLFENGKNPFDDSVYQQAVDMVL